MIILIGGVSCTGKTVMAQKLLERYKISYLSLDHLKMGLYRGNPNCGFTPTSKDEVIAETLWPIVKGIIMTAIENEQDLILEGCYILPHLVKDLREFYLKHCLALFLGFSSHYIEKNYAGAILEHRSAIEQRLYPDERTLSQFMSEHDSFRKQCLISDATYFEIHEDYETEILAVYDYIKTRMRDPLQE